MATASASVPRASAVKILPFVKTRLTLRFGGGDVWASAMREGRAASKSSATSESASAARSDFMATFGVCV
jgi:hypothetical protein